MAKYGSYLTITDECQASEALDGIKMEFTELTTVWYYTDIKQVIRDK